MRAESNVAIPSELNDFIKFFSESLGDVRFPDVDRETLAELADRVRDRADRVARLGEELDAARAELDAARGALRRTTQRGLAYARIYAEGNDELSERIAGLDLAREPAEQKPRRRGRPRSKAAAKDKAGKSADKPTLPFDRERARGSLDRATGPPRSTGGEPRGQAA